MSQKPLVAVVLGSVNDVEAMEPCLEKLKAMEVPHELRILSAHRTPEACAGFAREAAGEGFKVLIAAAGMSAALPGALAAHTVLPVIGVPLKSPLAGLEALYSIVQMPGGVPVACVAVGKAGPVNAALLATQILGVGDPVFQDAYQKMRNQLREKGLAADQKFKESHSWTPRQDH